MIAHVTHITQTKTIPMHVSPIDIIALLLAPRALVDAWMHSGGLFAELRDWIDVWGSQADVTKPRRWRDWLREQVAFLLNCAFCLSYYAAFWILLLFYGVLFWLPPGYAALGRFVIYWLALAQVSTLLLRIRHDE